MKQSKTEIIHWVIMLIPILYLWWAYDALHGQVAIHWNIEGEADGFVGKNRLPYLILALNIPLYLLMKFIPALDPKKKNTGNNFQKIRLAITMFMAALSMLLIYKGAHPDTGLDAGFVLIVAFFAFLGNYMISLKPNYFVGIRTPWTLESDMVWRKTHQLGGKVWFYGGILAMLAFPLVPVQLFMKGFLAFVIGSAIFFFVYSYILYKNEGTTD